MIEMSLELRLMPLALAALAEADAHSSSGGSIILESRFKDVEILQEALSKMKIESKFLINEMQSQKTEALVVKNERLSFSFVRAESGNFRAVFPPSSQIQSCEEILQHITQEYGKVLQTKLVQRIERSAAASGFRLGNRVVNSDRSVTLTLGLT